MTQGSPWPHSGPGVQVEGPKGLNWGGEAPGGRGLFDSGGCLREGFWITPDGTWHLVDEHCRWLQRDLNAQAVGLPAEARAAIQAISWDFDGRGRRAILALAMDHGLIRTRGHGPGQVTFEFAGSTDEAIRACLPFMRSTLGPASMVKTNNLRTGESLAFVYGQVLPALEAGDFAVLRPGWRRPAQVLPLARPFLVMELEEPGAGWHAWSLPLGSAPQNLLEILREQAPRGTGWLALEDGRTWRISPTAPPLRPLIEVRPAQAKPCPDCGWPVLGTSTPCQCENRVTCRVCGLPRFWPIPGRRILTLDGQVLSVTVLAGYGHRCLHWPSVSLHTVDALVGQGG